MSLARINAKLQAQHPEVELVRGEGYHYFIFDAVSDRNFYETESVYIPYTSSWPVERWVEEGLDFAQRMLGKINERSN